MRRAEEEQVGQAPWSAGTAGEPRGRSEAEAALIEAKLRMAEAVRALRLEGRLSQDALARRMGSNQPRVAKLENGDREVSLDLQMRAVFAASLEARREFRSLVERWRARGRSAPPPALAARARRRR